MGGEMGSWVYILYGCGLLLIAGVFLALGAAIGAANSYDQFRSLVIPLLSMLGSWVAGIGALSAVFVSLWMADRQRREDTENLMVRPGVCLITNENDWFVNVEVVSNGRRPSVVHSLKICSPHSKMFMQIIDFYHQSAQLPARLEYGEGLSFILTQRNKAQIKEYIDEHCDGRNEGLEVVVSTSLSTFKAPFDGNLEWVLDEV